MAENSNVPAAQQQSKSTNYQPVSPFIRYFNHCLAGITESRQIAVRIDPDTMDIEYEPTKSWLKNATTLSLLGATVAAIMYRRRRLEKVGGLVSLAGASRPILSGVAWFAGIAGLLNARPARQAPQSSEPASD
ncbi:hypothetical protein LPJ78_004128 [Coemansia sp. RSA 989]|nr:hypothetical protein BX667DRAFT_518634 [Coemansia mojavensis]KAJ1742172.1 hypothetical protein LPJ68_002156 [Coemansia sp. RSA 1086]KAJ1863300.1 hypothetical protein LPJ78_004128 [Coemansia sp. RSA 989]KAJ1874634.1 hypothetical protein LPJ55_001367 [Coemansia sp. RSA 990]KAJ2623868.1 hypothetical protein H4R22_005091 [Coemansia sp. RSA 1290]KAJ2648664.1 hypothetical protein IWW40_003728 [Coemansia sp. RSA 1250]